MMKAKYIKSNTVSNRYDCIEFEAAGEIKYVPLDPANTDYVNIMQLVAEGKLTIAPAE